MKLYNQATIDNPMANIEDLYSKGGLDALEMDFIHKVTGKEDNYSHVLDIKNDYYPNAHQNPNTLEISEDLIYFSDELYMCFVNLEFSTLTFFNKRLEQANSESEEKFILKKVERSLNKVRNFIIDNPKIHLVDEHYKFISNLIKKIHKSYQEKTGNFVLANLQITDEQVESLSFALLQNEFMENEDMVKFHTFLKAKDIAELSGTIKIGFNNKLFRYLLDKMYDYSILKLNFTDIIHSGFFLNKKGKPFKIGDLYSAKTNKPPKNNEMIDKIFLEILGKKF
jgi:hypothetical protein